MGEGPTHLVGAFVGRVPLVDAVTSGSSLDQTLPPQVGEMGKGFRHRQVSLKLQECLYSFPSAWQLNYAV
jgi:hypothetical protein